MKHLLSAFLCFALFLSACTLTDSTKLRLEAIGVEIATAAGIAAASAALTAAETELTRLESEPISTDPMKQLLQTSAIQAARELVTKARQKLAEEAASRK